MAATTSVRRLVRQVLLLGVTVATVFAQAQPKANINRELDRAAGALAIALGDPQLRQFLSEALESSTNREQLVGTVELIRLARGRPNLRQQAASLAPFEAAVLAIQRALTAAKVPAPYTNVEVYFPVPAHRTSWKGEDNLIVASAPVGDERQVQSLTGFGVTGERRFQLSPDSAPTAPTLIVAVEEHESHRRLAPAVKTAPPESEPPDIRGDAPHENSYVGIPYVLLDNDHEPWYRGDPEVYVLVGQSRQQTPLEHKIWLNSGSSDVNDENEWYYLGDGPAYPLYFYYNQTFSDDTYFHFWESDGGGSFTINASVTYGGATVSLTYTIKDDDDDMGKRTITKSSVPLVGYLSQSTGEVRFRVDRDP
jgi:hypothetical protein